MDILKNKKMSNLTPDQNQKAAFNVVVDVFIIFAQNETQATDIQNKLTRMGFGAEICDIKKTECYYIGSIISSDDERHGRKIIQWGRDEVEKSKYFKASLISYNNFMKI